jgi:hypothetical protein
MTAIMMAFFTKAGTTSETLVVGVSASAFVGDAQSVIADSVTFNVSGVAASASTGDVSTFAQRNVLQNASGISASALVQSVQVQSEGAAFPLPADSVLIWDKTNSGDSVPAGFSEINFSGVDYMIQGSNTANANTFISSAGSVTGNNSSSGTAGAHGTPWNSSGLTDAGFGSASVTYSSTAGGHFHTIIPSGTVPVTTLPSGFGVKLITNASQVNEIPQNAVMFSDSGKTGFSRKTWGASSSFAPYIAQRNTFSTVGARSAQTFTATLTDNGAGSHQHTTSSTIGPGGTVPSQTRNIAAGAHSHALSTGSNVAMFVFQTFKHLLPFVANSPNAVRSGMIVMYKGASVPAGWSLCDGTNGTPNMVGFFLGYNNNASTTDTVVGAREVNITGVAPGGPGSNTGAYFGRSFSVTLNSFSWNHGHSGSTTTITNQQSHFHSDMNATHSHSANVSVTISSTFVPNSFRLAFIRKD